MEVRSVDVQLWRQDNPGMDGNLESLPGAVSDAGKNGPPQAERTEITPLGDSAALVLGQWNVERESEPLSGNFSLVVRKFDDRWLIVHDHTSRSTE